MKSDLLFSSFPFITTETLSLSCMQETDLDTLPCLLGEDESPGEFLHSGEVAFAGRLYIQLGAYPADRPNSLLGYVRIGDFDYHTGSASIDFRFTALQENFALAREAVSAAIHYLFETIELSRIYARVVNADPLWERVLERCGLTREGFLRRAVALPNQEPGNLSFYSLLQSEYPMVSNGLLIARREELSLVRMTGNDYPRMAAWLSDERVLKYYEGRDNPFTLEKVVEKFQPRVQGKDRTTPCMLRDAGTPVGYLQFYPITTDLTDLKLTEYHAPYGVDLFIGEQACRGKGLGPRFLRLLCTYLFAEQQADVIVGTPQAWNQRSVNAFARAGFTQEVVLADHELHEGRKEAAIIMHRLPE